MDDTNCSQASQKSHQTCQTGSDFHHTAFWKIIVTTLFILILTPCAVATTVAPPSGSIATPVNTSSQQPPTEGVSTGSIATPTDSTPSTSRNAALSTQLSSATKTLNLTHGPTRTPTSEISTTIPDKNNEPHSSYETPLTSATNSLTESTTNLREVSTNVNQTTKMSTANTVSQTTATESFFTAGISVTRILTSVAPLTSATRSDTPTPSQATPSPSQATPIPSQATPTPSQATPTPSKAPPNSTFSTAPQVTSTEAPETTSIYTTREGPTNPAQTTPTTTSTFITPSQSQSVTTETLHTTPKITVSTPETSTFYTPPHSIATQIPKSTSNNVKTGAASTVFIFDTTSTAVTTAATRLMPSGSSLTTEQWIGIGVAIGMLVAIVVIILCLLLWMRARRNVLSKKPSIKVSREDYSNSSTLALKDPQWRKSLTMALQSMNTHIELPKETGEEMQAVDNAGYAEESHDPQTSNQDPSHLTKV